MVVLQYFTSHNNAAGIDIRLINSMRLFIRLRFKSARLKVVRDPINSSCSLCIWTCCATILSIAKILSASEVITSSAGVDRSDPHRYVE